jgi:glycosyltransferase involved in cell wall biosynthesis
MISFIVIGRNEGWKLKKCIQSILDTIIYNKLDNYEIIYVDSQSTDDSLDIAKSFGSIKIFQITGTYNAAIGRNIGANESKGEILFFIDGDMEIIPDFLHLVYAQQIGLKYDFVSGQFENNYYDNNGNFLYKENYHSLKNDIYQSTTGGLFIIKNNLWESVKGMRTKYRRSQDLDLGLNLSKIGVKLLRKKELLAKHHTIAYKDSVRMWKMLVKGFDLYRVVLFRDHYRSSAMHRDYLRTNYSNLFLIFSVFMSIMTNSYFLFLLYFAIIIVRSGFNMRTDIINFPNRIVYFFFRDISFIFAFFLFWPKEKQIDYIRIK